MNIYVVARHEKLQIKHTKFIKNFANFLYRHANTRSEN